MGVIGVAAPLFAIVDFPWIGRRFINWSGVPLSERLQF
jgi:hypothetical protein